MIQTLFGSLDKPEKRSVFDRMREAVSRTRDSFSERIENVVALTREIDETALDQLEEVLVASDIGTATTAAIIDALHDRALRHSSLTGDQLKGFLREQLLGVLQSVEKPPRHVNAPPEVILLVGVNGTGKTTTSGKLAAFHRRAGRTVLLCAADTFRAAAIEQLEVWAQRSGVEMIKTRQGGDPSAVLFDALQAAKSRGTDLLLVDTAGRLHTKTGLMAELDKMRRTTQRIIPEAPHEVLLVLDATTGQNGLQQARLFTESAGVTGIVLTKLDGTAKGGIVLAIAQELKLPVRFVGIGEKMEDLLPFNSEAFIDSLLGA